MENFENMPRPEIVLVADTVAREKNIDREDVFVAMEVAIQKAGRTKYGFEHDIRATIDRKTGAISLARYREVVPDDAVIENEAALPFIINSFTFSNPKTKSPALRAKFSASSPFLVKIPSTISGISGA